MNKLTNYVPHLIAMMPDHHRETIIERAAILEFDGKLKREDAEREALAEWQRDQRKAPEHLMRDLPIDRKTLAAGE